MDASRCALIHDLRKNIRELRYSMELFQPLYDAAASDANRHTRDAKSRGRNSDEGDAAFAAALERLIALQVAIGTMHDAEVALAEAPRLARCQRAPLPAQ